MKLERIPLPRRIASLSQLSQSATHVLLVDREQASLLIDVSAKKAVVHELPAGQISGGFSADGQRLVLLSSRTPRVLVLETATRRELARFEVKTKRRWGVTTPYEVSLHPDGERIFVKGRPETIVFSLKGKVLDRIGTPGTFELSPSGTHLLFGDAGKFMLRPMEAARFVKFEALSATWCDDQTLVATTPAQFRHARVNRVDAKTGKLKKFYVLPPPDPWAAHGRWVLAITVAKKVGVSVIDLGDGRTQPFVLPGAAATTCVSAGASRGYVAVNGQKALHGFIYAASDRST